MTKNKELSMCIKCNTENLPFFPYNPLKNNDSFNNEFLTSDEIRIFFTGINDVNEQQTDQILNGLDLDISPILDCKYTDLNSGMLFPP